MILIGRLTKNTIPTVEVTDKIIKKSFSVWFKVKKKGKRKERRKKKKGLTLSLSGPEEAEWRYTSSCLTSACAVGSTGGHSLGPFTQLY